MSTSDELRAEASISKAWPFEEARKLTARYPAGFPARGVVFETGYGPSGLPHIGTFQEVLRTTMVRRAFGVLHPDVPTRLIAFSDDMDGLRKVPGNVPNPDLLAAALNKPLSQVPDPFGTHPSFGAHNNARLRAFLDRFGFDYEFLSSTECYTSGRFDAALRQVLAHYAAIMDVVLPTLGPDRRASYSPFLPISPVSGQVLQVPVETHGDHISYVDPATGGRTETVVTGGAVKLQWKVDWGMRWVALGVDYEMSGKDLIDSVTLSSRIARILGGRPPEGFSYELFLDEHGAKISKSKGNGLTIEDWLTYASPDSLAFYLYREPRRAKKLHFDVIPRAVDEYHEAAAKFAAQETREQLGNAAYHVYGGPPPAAALPVTFGLLLNLAGVAHTSDPAVLWEYLRRYEPDAAPATHPELDAQVRFAAAYYRDHVAPTLQRRAPSRQEAGALCDLATRLRILPADASSELIQNEVYAAGKASGIEPLRAWFAALYETLLGASQGPRMGSFFALYGLSASIQLLEATAASAANDE